MKGTYDKTAFTIESPNIGIDTGPDSQTEQAYLPIAVQIKRMINAGEQIKLAKKEMYDIGWDEDYNLNTVLPHAVNMNLEMVEMQEIVENASEIPKLNTTEQSTLSNQNTNIETAEKPATEPPETANTVQSEQPSTNDDPK